MDEVLKTGVIGHPIGQTLSPLIHNHWIKQYGFSALYQAIEIIPERFESSVTHMIDEGYCGFNVTLPFKQKIMELCDVIDQGAEHIGAVNTVQITQGGRVKGLNTDAFGFMENLIASGEHINIKDNPVFVLGAGGAARAIVYALDVMGASEIRLTNRTKERAEQISKDFNIKIIDWDNKEQGAKDASFLVNTTSLGMAGQESLGFDLKHLPKEAGVCDIVYKPLYTPLLKSASKRGNKTVTGIGMLLHQARPAFEAWFGVMPDVSNDLLAQIEESIA